MLCTFPGVGIRYRTPHGIETGKGFHRYAVHQIPLDLAPTQERDQAHCNKNLPTERINGSSPICKITCSKKDREVCLDEYTSVNSCKSPLRPSLPSNL